MATKWRVLIVDDEQPAREKLALFLSMTPDFEVVAQAKNGVEALECAELYRPDIIFLDIQMPKLDGLSVATNLQDQAAIKIVFVTGFNQHAIKAFELNALDYLLKPFDKGRLQKTLERLRLQSTNTHQYSMAKLVKDYRNEQEYAEQLMFKTDNAIEIVQVDNIEWVESSGNYVKVCLINNAFIARQTLNSVQSQLDPKKYLRIHRSYLVNLAMVEQAVAISKGDFELVLGSGTHLKLSRNYQKQFFENFKP
jgi:two-component system, LytTR family, response regulator